MKTLLILLVTLLCLFTTACISQRVSDANLPEGASERYVFIDHHVSETGEALDNTSCGGPNIDFPTYSFNRETGELYVGSLNYPFPLNESLKIIYGNGYTPGGVFGSGEASNVYPFYSLPFEEGDINITGLTPTGFVTFTRANETITLAPEETWKNITTTTGFRTIMGGYGNCSVAAVRTETIYNAGLIGKNHIVRR